MKYAVAIFAVLLALVAGLYLPVFGQHDWSQLHSDFIRAQGNSIAVVMNSDGAGGTGFIVKGASGGNYLLTNGHVCNLAVKGQIFADYQGDRYVLRVVKQYQLNDLCAIEAPSSGIPLPVAKSSRLGQTVYILGHPLLEPLSNTTGEISAFVSIKVPLKANPTPEECKGETYSIVQAPPVYGFFGIESFCVRSLRAQASTAPILPGNSGSPVLNGYGRVVGVAFASIQEGIRSYIVPLSAVRDFLRSL